MITFNSQLVFVSNELESYKLRARDLVGQLKNVKTAISKVQDPTLVALLYQNGMPEIHLMDLNFLDVPNFSEFMIREETSPLCENTDEKVTDLKKPLIGQQLNHFNICNLSQENDNVLKSATQTPRSCDPIILRRLALLSSSCKSPEDSWRTDESSISTRRYSVEGMKAIEFSFISVEDAHQEILRLNKTILDLLNQNSQQEMFQQKDEMNENIILDLQSQVATLQDMVSNLKNDTEEKEEEIHLLNDKILEMEIINGRNEVQINDNRISATNLKTELDSQRKHISCIVQDYEKLNKEHINLGKQKIEGDKIVKDFSSISLNLKAKEDSIKLLKNLQIENESELESVKKEILDKQIIIENRETIVTEVAAKNSNLKQKCIHLRDFIKNLTNKCKEWDKNYRKLQLLCKSHEQDANQSLRKVSDLELQQTSMLKENKHLARKLEGLENNSKGENNRNIGFEQSGDACLECKYLRKAICIECTSVSTMKQDLLKKEAQIISLKKINLVSQVSNQSISSPHEKNIPEKSSSWLELKSADNKRNQSVVFTKVNQSSNEKSMLVSNGKHCS